MESEKNQGFQPEITIESRASEQVVSDELYLTYMEEITPVTVEMANGLFGTATDRGIAELEVKRL